MWCPKAARDSGGKAGMVQRNIVHPTGTFYTPQGLWLCVAFPVETDSFSCEPVPFSFLIFCYRPEQEFSKPLVCITLADLLPLHEPLPMDEFKGASQRFMLRAQAGRVALQVGKQTPFRLPSISSCWFLDPSRCCPPCGSVLLAVGPQPFLVSPSSPKSHCNVL